ncbi:MAG TPA: cupin domain-containing protein [Chryseolinea sp.]|nr:cupin domain-containing protein [Chryseolinea sp.]
MAYKNKVINNPKTGQSISFLLTSIDTKGELLEMESTFRPFSKEPPAHYHPCQVEDFLVLSGELTLRLNGKVTIYKKNQGFHVPVNTVHSMWNGSGEKTIINWKCKPALTTENLLETISGLANADKTNANGVPTLLQTVLIANKYSKVYRATKPPYFLQKILFIILTPFSYLLGYRPSYKKYLN